MKLSEIAERLSKLSLSELRFIIGERTPGYRYTIYTGAGAGTYTFTSAQAQAELHRRDVEAFRSQHDAPPEEEWDDELRLMFAIQYPVARS